VPGAVGVLTSLTRSVTLLRQPKGELERLVAIGTPLGGQPDSLLLKMTEKKVRRLYRRTF